MSDYLDTNIQLVAKHVPDSSMEQGPEGIKHKLELPGHVEIGVDVGGAFFPLTKIGKARFDKHVYRARANNPSPPEPSGDEQV